MSGVVRVQRTTAAQVFHLFLWRVLENVITLEQKIFAYFLCENLYICTMSAGPVRCRDMSNMRIYSACVKRKRPKQLCVTTYIGQYPFGFGLVFLF